MSVFSHFIKQSFFLPKPTLTEKNLPDQSSRVVIVTGGYTGLGFELVKIIYQRNAIVYIAGRSMSKGEEAIKKLRASFPQAKGRVEFLQLDLGDLSTIKSSADEFLGKEQRLDVLVNNAGVMTPPVGSKSAQGSELQLATNVLAPFLFTKLLTPLLLQTAETAAPGSVRISWAASLGVDVYSPPGGAEFDSEGNLIPKFKDQWADYGTSKVGNVFLASEFARRYQVAADGMGVINNSFNPGNLSTELQRYTSGFFRFVIGKTMLFPPVFGGYTELFAGWAEEAGRVERNAAYIWPWGRFGGVRADVQAEIDKEGGKAEKLWEWCRLRRASSLSQNRSATA